VTLRNSTQSIEELLDKQVVMLEYLVDGEVALVLTSSGDIMTLAEDGGAVSIKAQN
jgi:hypothetical protein